MFFNLSKKENLLDSKIKYAWLKQIFTRFKKICLSQDYILFESSFFLSSKQYIMQQVRKVLVQAQTIQRVSRCLRKCPKTLRTCSIRYFLHVYAWRECENSINFFTHELHAHVCIKNILGSSIFLFDSKNLSLQLKKKIFLSQVVIYT